ncbi:MAG: Dabb family protein [Deltaproteobacteria bacterium]|jgi:hypothetical protein|nr:Dabb family protein [Deltaproteobacteria bacterium]
MIMHIVLFKLKDRRPEEVTKAREKLMELAGRVPQLRSLEVVADIVRAERSFDLALLATFDSLADMQAYQVHPHHVQVGIHMRSVAETIVSLDYEK